eukprot:9092144-Pyramimonas_sp.AAC.1
MQLYLTKNKHKEADEVNGKLCVVENYHAEKDMRDDEDGPPSGDHSLDRPREWQCGLLSDSSRLRQHHRQ